MFMTPRENLAPGVLLIEQESYLSLYKKGDTKDVPNFRSIFYNS